MKKPVLLIAALVLVFALIQLIPVDRSNPPVQSDIPTTSVVKAILKRACYDCHSNETRWPWYSRIAPASWLIAWDVSEGREELNFSTWNRYDAGEHSEKIKESWEEVQEGEMPPWFYTALHPEARLSEQDLAVLRRWAGVHAGSVPDDDGPEE